MQREFKGSPRVIPFLVGGIVFLWDPLPAVEGIEAVPRMESSVSSPVPEKSSSGVGVLKPFRQARRAVLGGMARGAQPFMNYSRHHLVKLLPSKKYLPPHLSDREHWDYPRPLQWVPRGWTAYNWGRPAMVLGNQKYLADGAPKPVGERGSFQLSVYPNLPAPFCWVPVYVAFTLPNGVHFRLGARWDDVDAYVSLPSVAIKKKVK